MYLWYVYQPSRSDKKKKKDESTAGGKAKKEKEGRKEKRDRTKSTSQVHGTQGVFLPPICYYTGLTWAMIGTAHACFHCRKCSDESNPANVVLHSLAHELDI